jgi:hypothetical protein
MAEGAEPTGIKNGESNQVLGTRQFKKIGSFALKGTCKEKFVQEAKETGVVK